MEGNVFGADNPVSGSESTSLNEATPAAAPAPAGDAPGPAECDNAISSTTPDKFSEELVAGIASTETEADFFSAELGISDVPSAKITENVEDIVQDLENLLGESSDGYRFGGGGLDSSKLAESYNEVNSSNDLYQLPQGDAAEVSLEFECNIPLGAAKNAPDDEDVNEAIKVAEELTSVDSIADKEVLKEIGDVESRAEETQETKINTSADETSSQCLDIKLEEVIIPVLSQTDSEVEKEVVDNSDSISSKEVFEETSTISPHNILKLEPGNVDISFDTNLEKGDEHLQESVTSNEVVMQPDENAVDLLQELIAASECANIDTINCLDSLVANGSSMINETNEADIEQQVAAEVDADSIIGNLQQQFEQDVPPLDVISETSQPVLEAANEGGEQEQQCDLQLKNNDHLSEAVENLEKSISELMEEIEPVDPDQQVLESESDGLKEIEELNEQIAASIGAVEPVEEFCQQNLAPVKEPANDEELNEIPMILNEKVEEQVEHVNQEFAVLDGTTKPVEECNQDNQKSVEIQLAESVDQQPIMSVIDEKPNIESNQQIAELNNEEEQIENLVSQSEPGEQLKLQIATSTDEMGGYVKNEEAEPEKELNEAVLTSNEDAEPTDETTSEIASVDQVPSHENNTHHCTVSVEEVDEFSEVEEAVKAEDEITTIQEESHIPNEEKKETVINESNEAVAVIDYNEEPASLNDTEMSNEASHQQQEDADQQIDSSVEKMNEEPVTAIDETEQTEEVAPSRSTELVQPLMVEVEDPDLNEQQSAQEQNASAEEVSQSEASESEEVLPPNAQDVQTNRTPLKMTITKNKSDNAHSILKIYDPNEAEANQEQQVSKLVIKSTASSTTENSPKEEQVIPKITIKPVLTPTEAQSSPKVTIKPIKPPREDSPEKLQSPKTSTPPGTASPRITIKPVVKPEPLSPLKLTIRPFPKSEEAQSSPKLNIKPIIKPSEEETEFTETHHSPKISFKSSSSCEERPSPRITIKPIVKPADEITKEEIMNYAEERHSPRITIKPIIKPADEAMREEAFSEERQNPKITIKPIIKPEEERHHSPRITIKPVVKPPDEASKDEDKVCSRITIKPILKPEECIKEDDDVGSNPRITIKPILKPSEEPAEEVENRPEERQNPRITIKPIVKPVEEEYTAEDTEVVEERQSPRITIKPIVKPENEAENMPSPRITIKPIVKPSEPTEQDDSSSGLLSQPFKLNIKPVVKPSETTASPKVTIKPVPKPEPESEPIELIDFEEQIKQERIVLKIAKNSRREKAAETEKLKKIKVKLSKERDHAQIVPRGRGSKRAAAEQAMLATKHFKSELPSDLSISLVSSPTNTVNLPDVTITRVENAPRESPRLRRRDDYSNESRSAPTAPAQVEAQSMSAEDIPDPLADIPVFEITLESAASMSSKAVAQTATPTPTPRKRGRPRKVPLEVREDFKDPKEEEAPPAPIVEESTRPKRSCRGVSVKTTLGIKPRKPRAASTRGRGNRRTVSTRASTAKQTKERKAAAAAAAKLRLSKDAKESSEEPKDVDAKDVGFKQVPPPGDHDVVIYEEETRMSADNSSRAQTPAKQVLSSVEVIEESQSSVQSNTTTESGDKVHKVRKGPRLEVHQEPEGEVISADKLAEYSWGGGGPYMLQEQVAQFLGIKSFKRKYPGIQRRPVDMQERDFIRESCLASEAMCDMGLTAVKSEDILDIMYTDFQHKYEEYCKHQRDRQAKDVSNKQKALSLAASQEKNKLDIVEQAVQSAFQWNASFNKARREQRRACMDLQTFTVHFPKGKMKQVNKPSMGHYPLALVPGQYTDYYKKYTPLELGNLPLNTIGCKTVTIPSINQDTEESQSDGSGSDSDSSSSDSDSSYSGSSGAEDCKMCSHPQTTGKKVLVH